MKKNFTRFSNNSSKNMQVLKKWRLKIDLGKLLVFTMPQDLNVRGKEVFTK